MDNTIGKRIRRVRTSNKLNQKDFAARLNVTPAHISQIELGKNQASEQLLKLISLEYKVSYDWLLDSSGKMTERSPEQPQRQLPDMDAIILEAMKLNDKAYNFNPDYFRGILMDYKDYLLDTHKEASQYAFNEIMKILEKYMPLNEIFEEDIENKLWKFPNIAYSEGFLQGFQTGFTMFQYIQGRVSQ